MLVCEATEGQTHNQWKTLGMLDVCAVIFGNIQCIFLCVCALSCFPDALDAAILFGK